MSKTLVVIGATGSQGRAVIDYFQSQEPSWLIRGLTRNPASDTAVKIAKSGVDIVKADLNDVESSRQLSRVPTTSSPTQTLLASLGVPK